MAHDSTQLELEDLVGDGTQEPEVVLDQEHGQPVGLQAEQDRFEAVELSSRTSMKLFFVSFRKNGSISLVSN